MYPFFSPRGPEVPRSREPRTSCANLARDRRRRRVAMRSRSGTRRSGPAGYVEEHAASTHAPRPRGGSWRGGGGSSEPWGSELEFFPWVGLKKSDGAGHVSKGATSFKKFGQRGSIPPTSPPLHAFARQGVARPGIRAWHAPAGPIALKCKEWPFPGLLACTGEHARHKAARWRATTPPSRNTRTGVYPILPSKSSGASAAKDIDQPAGGSVSDQWLSFVWTGWDIPRPHLAQILGERMRSSSRKPKCSEYSN